MAVFPTPGSPIRTALFLVRRQSTCWTRSTSMCRPTSGIELILHRGVGQVAAELGEQRRFLDARQRRLLVQERDDVLADGVEPHPLFHQDGGCDRALLAQNTEQQMFRTDVVVQEPIGFFGRVLQHALGFGAEGDLDRRRYLLAKHGPAFDFLANAFEGQVRARENPAGEALALANQSEQEVLGFDRNAAELTRLVPGEKEDPPSPLRISFEHPGLPMVIGSIPISIIRQRHRDALRLSEARYGS